MTQVAELLIVFPLGSVFDGVAVPAAVTAFAAGRPIRPVWRNVLGGLTYEISGFFMKFAPSGTNLPLAREAERLAWAGQYTPVPRVVSAGADETGRWLITEALDGTAAVDERWRAEPAIAVRAIATGLRHLHDHLPVRDCPYDWSVQRRLADRAPDLSLAHPIHRDLPPAEVLRRAEHPPPIDRLVVCHGDPCAPNTLIGDDGRWAGHVDLAALGVADRWADLAVGSWSLSWNYGDGWEELFFDTYGIEPDPERIAYYRLLWDFGG